MIRIPSPTALNAAAKGHGGLHHAAAARLARTAYRHFAIRWITFGSEGRGGVGAGPGITVGRALALKDSGRLPSRHHGDGDFLMGATALWTAAHYGIPCLYPRRQ